MPGLCDAQGLRAPCQHRQRLPAGAFPAAMSIRCSKALKAETGVPIYGINQKDAAANAKAFLTELGNPYDAIGADAGGRASIDWGALWRARDLHCRRQRHHQLVKQPARSASMEDIGEIVPALAGAKNPDHHLQRGVTTSASAGTSSPPIGRFPAHSKEDLKWTPCPQTYHLGMKVYDSRRQSIGKIDDFKFSENATDPGRRARGY